MSWNIVDRGDFILYSNKFINLKVKVYETLDKDKVYMNYKGYNITTAMFIWQFEEYLEFASIEDVSMEGEQFDEYFIINRKDRNRFLDEMYYFLMENKIESLATATYKGEWK